MEKEETLTLTTHKKNERGHLMRSLFLAILFTFLFVVPFVDRAYAADLRMSPSIKTYIVGDVFSVDMYVSTPDQAMNAVSGTVSFPTDVLEVVSLGRIRSIINLWVQEPSFSNNSGQVTFEGVVLNPGFIGSNGNIITVNFRAKKVGGAQVIFSSSSILANDGFGTNILNDIGNARFSITKRDVAESEPIIRVPDGTPDAPNIRSSTHPDQNSWYNNDSALFEWDLTDDILETFLLVGKLPKADPPVSYVPPIDGKNIDDFEDGIWYFHAQLRNSKGLGEITHFKFQIDTKKPESFIIEEIVREDQTQPSVEFKFIAFDETSGISHYNIRIDDMPTVRWVDDGSHIYKTPALPSGTHAISVLAVDYAGNEIGNFDTFEIESIEPPIIDTYPQVVRGSEDITIGGFSMQNSEIALTLSKKDGDSIVVSGKSDSVGRWSVILSGESRVKEGEYSVWAQVIDERGAISIKSNTINISVGKSLFIQFGAQAVTVLSVIVPLGALVVMLLLLVFYYKRKSDEIKRKLRRDIHGADITLHKTFKLLRGDIKEQLSQLEKVRSKRELTKREEKILIEFRKDLISAEKYLSRDLKKIKKRIK